MMGELTPEIAQAVSSCTAHKFLVPLNRCGITLAFDMSAPTETYIDICVKQALEYLEELKKNA
jgi:hypothetical protein